MKEHDSSSSSDKYYYLMLTVFFICASICISVAIAEYSTYNREALWLEKNRLIDSITAQAYKDVKYEFWKNSPPSADDN